MAYPITGPFVTIDQYNDVVGPNSYWYYATGYRQAKPFNIPLSYFRRDKRTIWVRTKNGSDIPIVANAHAGASPWWIYAPEATNTNWPAYAHALNKARKRFVDKCGEQASLGVTVAERKQAMHMMGNRLKQLASAAVHIRHGRFSKAAQTLGISDDPRFKAMSLPNKARVRGKEFGNTWLEFWFGWKPLVQDIYSVMDVLSQPIPLGKVKASGTHKQNYFGESFHDDNNRGHQWGSGEIVARIRMQAEVSVENPNLNLASNLGVINPAELAWELVPYSFLVDWFVNVGDFLRSFSDLVGYTFQNTVWSHQVWALGYSSYLDTPTGKQWEMGSHLVAYQRHTSSIPNVVLTRKEFKELSPTRALTAASLLLQKLKVYGR